MEHRRLTCHVCAQRIEATCVAVEIAELARHRVVVWGPVPAHEGCDRAVVTPFDDRLGNGFERATRLLDVVPATGGLGLHALR